MNKENKIIISIELVNCDEVIEKLEKIKKLLDEIKNTKIEVL